MKLKQHIRVNGYPDVLKHHIPIRKPTMININGIGKINALSHDRTDKLLNLLDKHNISYTLQEKTEMIRVKYLLPGDIMGSVRGKVHGTDVIYTIEADDERELLDKTDAALSELKELNVEHEEVCKWFCMTGSAEPAKKTKKRRSKRVPKKDIETEEIERLSSIVEGHQQEIAELKERPIKKAIIEDRAVMAGVLS